MDFHTTLDCLKANKVEVKDFTLQAEIFAAAEEAFDEAVYGIGVEPESRINAQGEGC